MFSLLIFLLQRRLIQCVVSLKHSVASSKVSCYTKCYDMGVVVIVALALHKRLACTVPTCIFIHLLIFRSLPRRSSSIVFIAPFLHGIRSTHADSLIVRSHRKRREDVLDSAEEFISAVPSRGCLFA